MQCSTSNGDKNCAPCIKMLVAVLLVVAFTVGFDMLFNSVIMEDSYKATAALWRAPAEMKQLFPFYGVVTLALSLLFVKAYAFYMRNVCGGNAGEKAPCMVGKSLCFGLWFGLLIGMHDVGSYFFLPVPKAIVFSWFAADVIKYLFAALLVKCLFCNASATCTKKD